MFRSIVPVRASGDSRDAGDSERFRTEFDRPDFELEESRPASRFCKSSPSRESLPLRPLFFCGGKRTVRVALWLRCLPCPRSGVEGNANVDGRKCDESVVNGCVSSSSAAPGEKNAGPSSRVTDTMSSPAWRVVLIRGKLSLVARDDLAVGNGRSSASSS